MIFDTSPEGIGEDTKREEDNKEVLEADATGIGKISLTSPIVINVPTRA